MVSPLPETLWIPPAEVEPSIELLQAAGGSALLAAVLARRGLRDPETVRAFLDPDQYQPASPYELPGLQTAVKRLQRALSQGEQIAVWGDFDVDGQTATTLLVQGLSWLGAQVSYYIPHRERESHGLNLPGLRRLVAGGARLVLTCDTGIAAVEAGEYLHQQGVDFLITDHHELPEQLPQALALVNPRFLPPEHPLAALPGVGVAYQLMLALLEQAGQGPAAETLLDLVALGIVADVAEQVRDTRYLLQRGLQVLRRTERLGLLNLLELASLQKDRLNEEHIAFALGPRLNALGRLGDANQAVELLTTAETGRARLLASHIEGLNTQRKLLTDQVYQSVYNQIERDPALLQPAVLVFSNPEWPAGVIGIVASRLAERYRKPVILFAAPPGGVARGSARSIAGINITQAIATQRHLLHNFGGHPMAAGLAIDSEQIPAFRQALSRSVRPLLAEIPAKAALTIDAELPLGEMSLDLLDELEQLAPFGPGNPTLTFTSQPLELESVRPLGRSGEHLRVNVQDEQGNTYPVMFWQGAGWHLPQRRFRLAYSVRASNYLGKPGLQFEWQDAAPLVEHELGLQDRADREIHDQRAAASPETALAALGLPAQAQIWAEALHNPPPRSRTREQLEQGPLLVIYTPPPGQMELRAAIKLVQPQEIYLFAAGTPADAAPEFLLRLGGLVKHTLSRRSGQVELAKLAATLGQREATVLAGLDWLAAAGQVQWHLNELGIITLTTGTGVSGDRQAVDTRLQQLLQETRAYRNYYRQAATQSFTDL
jgi:single-stranded-DNA-specific exonuclease